MLQTMEAPLSQAEAEEVTEVRAELTRLQNSRGWALLGEYSEVRRKNIEFGLCNLQSSGSDLTKEYYSEKGRILGFQELRAIPESLIEHIDYLLEETENVGYRDDAETPASE